MEEDRPKSNKPSAFPHDVFRMMTEQGVRAWEQGFPGQKNPFADFPTIFSSSFPNTPEKPKSTVKIKELD